MLSSHLTWLKRTWSTVFFGTPFHGCVVYFFTEVVSFLIFLFFFCNLEDPKRFTEKEWLWTKTFTFRRSIFGSSTFFQITLWTLNWNRKARNSLFTFWMFYETLNCIYHFFSLHLLSEYCEQDFVLIKEKANIIVDSGVGGGRLTRANWYVYINNIHVHTVLARVSRPLV